MDNAIQKNRITEGRIGIEALKYFFPLLVGTLFQQAYNMVDGIIVGRFVGKVALAAIGGSAATYQIIVFQLLTALFGGMSVILSQYFGAKDEERLHKALHTMIAFCGFVAVFTTIFGIGTTRLMMNIMDTPDNLMKDSLVYLYIFFGGSLATVVYNAGASILRAMGDSKRPLYYLIVCCIVNVILDVAFVVYLGMGVAGAALATVIAQAVSAILIIRSLVTTRSFMNIPIHISFNPGVLKSAFDTMILKKEVRTGVPGMFQALGYSITNVIIQASINSFSTDIIAAWGAYFKVDGVYWAIMGAFGITVTTFCGQNYGAGKLKRTFRIVRTIMLQAFAIAGAVVVILMVYAEWIFGLYTKDANVISIGVEMAMDLLPWYNLCIITEILCGALRGFGDVKIPTAIVMGTTLAIRIPWMLFVVPVYHTLFNVIISYPLAWGFNVSLLLVYYFIRKKHYLKNAGDE